MKKLIIVTAVALCFAGVEPLGASSSVRAESHVAAGAVKVTVRYTGKGNVDSSHKIWVWLFDTPNIGPGSQPIDQIALDKNGATAEFVNVGSGQVWIAVAFDLQGAMTGNEPPPSGSPIAIHAGASGAPSPVTPGDQAAVTIAFDDALRMP